MYIACDIDNTLCLTNLELLKKGYDISVYPASLPKDFWNNEGKNILLNAKLIKTTVNFLLDYCINKHNSIIFVTARDEKLKDVTHYWLKNNGLINICDDVIFTKNRAELDVDLFIDDAPYELQQYINKRKKFVMIKWLYNKDYQKYAVHTLDII